MKAFLFAFLINLPFITKCDAFEAPTYMGKEIYLAPGRNPQDKYYNFAILERATSADARRAILFRARKGVPDKDKEYVNVLDEGWCSGAIVQFDREDTFVDKKMRIPYLVTAFHCGLTDYVKDEELIFDHFLGLRGSFGEKENYIYSYHRDQGSRFIEGHKEDVQMFYDGDANQRGFKKIQDVVLASKRTPVIGQKLRAVGYPQGQGPYTLNCIYSGRELVQPAVKTYHDRHIVMSVLFCPSVSNKQIVLSGFSGSPILDDRNEYVGTLHAVRAFGDRQTGMVLFSEIRTEFLSDSHIIKSDTFEGVKTVHRELPSGNFVTCTGKFDWGFPEGDFDCDSTDRGQYIQSYNFKGVPIN